MGGKKRYLSIHGGFLEVLDDHVRVLADCAERAEEIDMSAPKRRCSARRKKAINPALGVDPAAALAGDGARAGPAGHGREEVGGRAREAAACSPDSTSDTPY